MKEEAPALSLKKKRMMIYFIEAAEKIVKEEGLGALSLRRVADAAGYNSATLYNYFDDLEYLTLFASVCYLRDYILLLLKKLPPDGSALERYRVIYQCFNSVGFRQPEIYHNLFFGKHSARLGEVLRIYYHELYPGELEGLPEQMKQMLCRGTMRERDSVIMQDLVSEGFVRPEKAEKTLELVIALHQHYIYEAAINGKGLDIAGHEARFLQLFDYILQMAK